MTSKTSKTNLRPYSFDFSSLLILTHQLQASVEKKKDMNSFMIVLSFKGWSEGPLSRCSWTVGYRYSVWWCKTTHCFPKTAESAVRSNDSPRHNHPRHQLPCLHQALCCSTANLEVNLNPTHTAHCCSKTAVLLQPHWWTWIIWKCMVFREQIVHRLNIQMRLYEFRWISH